jgi:hypothetical protein
VSERRILDLRFRNLYTCDRHNRTSQYTGDYSVSRSSIVGADVPQIFTDPHAFVDGIAWRTLNELYHTLNIDISIKHLFRRYEVFIEDGPPFLRSFSWHTTFLIHKFQSSDVPLSYLWASDPLYSTGFHTMSQIRYGITWKLRLKSM